LDTFIAILVGIADGLLGAIPFFVVRSRIKARMKNDGTGGIVIGIAATMVSFLIIAAGIVLCYLITRDSLLPFAISAITVFFLALIVYTATLVRK